MTVAGDLAEFLARTNYGDLPSQTTENAAMLIASSLASAAYGKQIQSSVILRDIARERGGAPQASLWFDPGPKLPVAEAAQVNAVMSDAAASDDSDLRAIVHCGTPLTATGLALAERTGATGRDVLAAIVLGYEAAGRIGDPISPQFRENGFHGCVIAIFAAAVAAGRLLKLDPPRLAQTIALAATSIGGLAAAANTSVAREYHAGLAVRSGIDAALAAARGFIAEERILEADKGFFRVFGGREGADVTVALGTDWVIVTDIIFGERRPTGSVVSRQPRRSLSGTMKALCVLCTALHTEVENVGSPWKLPLPRHTVRNHRSAHRPKQLPLLDVPQTARRCISESGARSDQRS